MGGGAAWWGRRARNTGVCEEGGPTTRPDCELAAERMAIWQPSADGRALAAAAAGRRREYTLRREYSDQATWGDVGGGHERVRRRGQRAKHRASFLDVESACGLLDAVAR